MGAHTVLIIFLWLFLIVHHVIGQDVVEGYVGGYIVLSCTLTPGGDLIWKRGASSILVKKAHGQVVIDTDYTGDVSLVNGADLMIYPLNRTRDGDTGAGDKIFECMYTERKEIQQIQLRLLDPAKITGVRIRGAISDRVTVKVGSSIALDCLVAGDPNPSPFYSWSFDGGPVSTQISKEYTFTPTKAMNLKTIKCTASNRITEESVFSAKEITVALNVQYLDLPSVPTPPPTTENNAVTLRCTATGNPKPIFQWRRSTIGTVSESADYTIENVHRSAAGEYTCIVWNNVTIHRKTTYLTIQYPPDVTVSYNQTKQTLACRAAGVPGDYIFSQWEHRIGGKLLQTLGQQSFLKLPDSLTYEDTGYYVCQVSNRIKSPQRGLVYVTPQSPAIFENQIHSLIWKEGDTNSISVPFYTYSDTPDVKVVWHKSGESTVLNTHREETGPVTLMIHGQIVSIEGTITVLSLRNVTRFDEANYTVTVTNNINGELQHNQTSFSMFAPTNRSGHPSGRSGPPVAAIVEGTVGAVIFIIICVVVIIVVRRGLSNSMTTDDNRDKKIYANKENAHENDAFSDHRSKHRGAKIVVNNCKGKRPNEHKTGLQNDDGRGNKAFSDGRWNQPSTEKAVNELYGFYLDEQHKTGHKSAKQTGSKEQGCDSVKDEGLENEHFYDDRWKKRDAEIAVNDLYGSYSGALDKKEHQPAEKRPVKAKKSLPPPKVKLDPEVSSENGQSSKSRGLKYHQLNCEERAGQPTCTCDPDYHPSDDAKRPGWMG